MVGALTNKPYSFKGRSWELVSFESFDFFDCLGVELQYDLKGLELLRVLPRVKGVGSYDWISDKTRFSLDGLKYQRLTQPYIKINNQFVSVSWHVALANLAQMFQANKFCLEGFVDGFVDVKMLATFKLLINKAGGLAYSHQLANFLVPFRAFYLLEQKQNSVSPTLGQCVVLLGYNSKLESPLFTLRLKNQIKLNPKLKIFIFGFGAVFSFPVIKLGTNFKKLWAVIEGFSPLAKFFYTGNKITIFLGSTSLSGILGPVYVDIFSKLVSSLFIKTKLILNVCFVPFNFSQIGALDLNFFFKKREYKSAAVKIGYFVNTDLKVTDHYTFAVYHGHHLPAHSAGYNILLPAKAPLEFEQIFFNIFGKPRKSASILPALGLAKENGNVFDLLINIVEGKQLAQIKNFIFYSDIQLLKYFSTYFLQRQVMLKKETFGAFFIRAFAYENFYKIYNCSFSYFMGNFYLSDQISKASPLMGLAATRFKKPFLF
jgi:NADH-quinone oxidoreductase subunit G